MPISVIIADDHPVVRDGLRLTIQRKAKDIRVVGEADDGLEVMDLANRRRADVYILDITMPRLNGIQTTRRLLRMQPDAKIIILSLHGGQGFVEESLENGAKGYIVKESATRDVIKAIRQVYKGDVFLSARVSKHIVEGFSLKRRRSRHTSKARLTPREKDVLMFIAQGLTSKEIADKFKVAPNTVHVHRNNLMTKLDIHKETDLVRYAIRQGLIEA